MSRNTSRIARMGHTREVSRLLCGASVAAVVLALPTVTYAQDQDRYWDANGAQPGSGGSGDWNTTSPVWSEANSDVLGPYRTWNNDPANPDNAIFGVNAPGVPTTAGTINITAPITVHNLTFQSVHGWVLNGGTLTLAGATPTINVLGDTTINSVIAGTAGLTKTGARILTLTGANTFSGGITLAGGTLSAATDAALGAASNNINVTANAALAITGGSTTRTVTIASGTTLSASGVGVGSALFTGAGNLNVLTGVSLTNDSNSYTGTTRFNACNGFCSTSFSSVRNLGEASALGAPTTVADGTITWNQSSQYTDYLIYTGDGDSSNRNWVFNAGSTGTFRNQGSGTLTLTGDFTVTGGASFIVDNAGFELLGVLGGNANMAFTAGAAGNITLGGANTYTGATTISGGMVNASVLADAGLVSTFGTGSTIALVNNGFLAYTGTGASSDRAFTGSAAVGILNNGTGALTLEGPFSFVAGGPADTLTFGGNGSFAGTNVFSGVISGAGNLASTGSSTWELTGDNTRVGALTIDGGTLRAGSASAFGTITGVTVNGGTLDLGGFDLVVPRISGTGGNVALTGADLTVSGVTPTNDSTYAGSLTGDGGLIKRGTSTLTLSGQSTYTGATTIQGGTLALDFSAASAPTSNIVGSGSQLVLAGGTLSIKGAAGETNNQAFNGVNVTAGTNRIAVTSDTGGTMNVSLGALSSSGGLLDIALPTSGTITTTNADGALTWATINGRDYAQVTGNQVTAFTAYTDKDEAATWLDGEVISDDDGDAATFSGLVTGSKQLGGLQYTVAQNSIVNVGAGQTLGVDGAIIVGSSVGASGKEIRGGALTGRVGGGTLGFLHNGTGNFRVSSQVTDNGGDAVGVAKAGTGTLIFENNTNSYTGATVLSGGIFQVTSIGNGGVNSALGASSADSSNLVLESGRFSYNGTTATTDRGFTLVNGGPRREIEVFGTTDLTFTGLVTSPDDAGLVKIGSGTLTLANDANNYTGVTRVEGGVLSVDTLADGGQASGIGAASSDPSNLVLLNSGALQYTGGSVEIDRGATIESGAGRIDVSNAATTLTMGGAIVGGRFDKYGDGTLVLTGSNTHAGTIVNAGTLRAGGTDVLGSPTGGMTVNAGGILDLADNSNQIGALNGGGLVTLGSLDTTTLTIGGANSGTPGFTGTISGAGNVTHTNGTQVMTGCGNSYTGVTTITGEFGGSTLSTDCIRNGGETSGLGASDSDAANLVFRSNGLLHYTAVATNQVTDRGFTLDGGFGYIHIEDAGTVLEFTGDVTGPGALIKRGAGTLVLSGVNDSAGETRVEAGTLRAGSDTAFSHGARLLMSNVAGALFDLGGFDATFSALDGGGTLGGNVALGGGTLTLTGTENRNFSGAISGSGGLMKQGPGTQGLLGCDSNYTGTTTLSSGSFVVNCLADGGLASSIGASGAAASNLVLGAGRFIYTGTGSTTDRLFTLGASTRLEASGTGALVFTNTGPIAFATAGSNQTITLGGTSTADNSLAPLITNNGAGVTSLTKSDAGTWILTNSANTYTGATSIIGGVLGVDTLANGGQASSIGQSSNAATNLVIGSGGTLRYTGGGDTTDRLFTLGVGTTAIESVGTGAIVFTNTGAVAYSGNGARVVSLGGTNTDDNVMGATIGDQGANVTSLAKNGSGTWVLTGNNTFTGSTVINDGNLVIGNGGTTGNAGTGNVIVDKATSTLSFNRSDTFNFTGTISGPGSIAQIGTGTTVLTATNGIGAARVDDGTLQVDGTLQTATFAMNGDGALTVNGTVEGATTGTASVFTGDAGASTVTVNAGGLLRANGDLGDGADALTLVGTINTGAGSFGLGAGDDTLTLNDGGTITGTVDAGAGSDTLVVNNALARTLDGANVGAFEALDKQNTGTLTLIGNHTYSAGTTIEAGTLSIGAGGTTGTLAGDVLNNGVLQFNRFDDLTFAGDISGTGSIVKLGTGSVATLTGDATHTGGTTISAGTLQIGDGGTTGSIAGDILNNASLRFDRSDVYTYDGVITGTGNVIQAGAGGTLNLTADSHWTGTALINNGSELRVASGNTVTAENQTNLTQGGTLTVSGTGSTWVTGFGAVSSGNGSSTLNVENGGVYRTTAGGLALRAAPGTPGSANVIVSGAGSLVDLAGALTVASTNAASLATVMISDGGTVHSTGANLIGAAAGNTAPSIFTIIGGGSNWTSTGTLAMSNGVFSMLGGGAANFASATIGSASEGAQVLVSGAGSAFTTTGDFVLGAAPGGTDTSSTGIVTLAAAGQLSVGGTFTIAADASSTGILNIGGAEGQAAAAAGVLDATALAFGNGTGRLNFNHTDADYGFATTVSGTGTINQVAGVTRLTGVSSAFGGTTNVSGGTLLVDGTLGGAASVVNVATGGTLGGTGTIGGNVNVADGTLTAGSNGIGTLTIDGNLALGSASQLAFEFGQADVPGGPLNDLVNVGGNLTLDGTINVTESAGGTFGPGIYRVINYGGALTDNGLEIGSMPGGSTVKVQTSVLGQVNLVNTDGLAFSFWDGATGPKFDDVINGGSGTWHLAGADSNWTDAAGALNDAWSDGTTAIFAGAAGTVTVDNGLGPVTAAGMQFATTGYEIEGDDLTLVGPQAAIQVGDSSAAGAGYIATISANLVGASQLVKTDLGTLVLTGVNTYAGGTLINGGVLSVANDGVLGDPGGAVTIDGGTLQLTGANSPNLHIYNLGANGGAIDITNAATSNGVLNGMSGTGGLTKLGAGSLALAGENTYTGGTTIDAGTLIVGGSTGQTTGSIVGDVVNNGTLTFDRSNAYTYAGSITGTGNLVVASTGVTTLTGNSSYAGGTRLSGANGQLRITGGANVISGGGTTLGRSTLSIDGANSLFSTASIGGTVTGSGATVVQVTGGGTLRTTTGGIDIRALPTVPVQLTVDGANSLVDLAGGIQGSSTYNAPFSTTISAGGSLRTAGASQIGTSTSNTNPIAVAVTGTGSNWTSSGSLLMTGGNFTIDQGGAASFASASFGTAPQAANLSVSGAGSSFATTGDLVIGSGAGTGALVLTDDAQATVGGLLTIAQDAGSTGTVTVGDGGLLRVTGGTLAMGTGNAVLNIGGFGMVPGTAGAGTLDAAEITFAAASNLVNFNHVDTGYVFATRMSGAGGVISSGSGVTILTADNAYSGTTDINFGTLIINGDQSAATGLTSANAAGTLGGSGVIGGAVIVGGHLQPGDLGAAPGTLTINGDLILTGGANLDYSFGQANVVGGAFNDLVEVGGNLTLDGTLNVAVTAGGSFDPGVYRVINYAGALNDQGLAVDPAYYVQTSVAHQVNLVNTTGLTMRFWDGVTGGKNDGIITGGDGVWHNSGGNDNWTEYDGSANAPFTDGAFAVFSGLPGTVTVNDTLGAVTASGMQFATDGYVIDGAALELIGPQSIVRVGDGTTDGADYIATIEAALTGDSQLAKSDLGTLVLEGTNSYTGGTRINAGTVQISSDANLGDASGGLSFEGGTLHATADITSNRAVDLIAEGRFLTDAGTTLTLDGAISGAGDLAKFGAGILNLQGASTIGGILNVADGTLVISDGGSLTDYRGYIGAEAGQIGEVIVSGSGSNWTSTNHIYVGYNGIGTLTIEDGATASSANGNIGLWAGSTGTVTVTGAGSSWTSSDNLLVGVGGEGALIVDAGATVINSFGFFAVGQDTGSTGTAVVSGAGSSITTPWLAIGNFGLGELTIANGAEVSGATSWIGASAGSRGTLNIGAAAGQGPVAAGILDTPTLTFRDGDGTLVFNHSDTGYVFSTALDSQGTGAHVLDHLAGTTVLTGDSFGFTGSTTVSGGTLLVGDSTGTGRLGGNVDVTLGGTLGGSGTIGGNVAIGDGGILAPGASVGRLTIAGDLALSSGSVLNFEFGEANVVGGTLNDLVDVGGDLVLDGTLDVSVPAGGSFGPGIYRVFDYGGTLTDNGLALGAMPGGAAVSVQTAIAGQVNLVNTAGLTLSFWDGDAGPKNNGLVDGGNGVWRVAGGSNNWTSASGSPNADYAQDSFAIFAGARGTVTVDNVGGAVLASGMQFASDGYTITGEALTLTGSEAIVQVGDSSAAGAGYTAVIASELTGTAGLAKTDLGTLVLTGSNTYTGGTRIAAGTLRIGNGGTSGSIVGDIVNDGALVVNRSGTLALDGAISGSGALSKLGSGTLTLGGTNSYAGGTTVSGGTVQVSSDANLGDVAGRLSLQGGTLQAGASFTSARDMLVGSSTPNRIDTQGFDVTLTGTIGNGSNNQASNLLDKVGSGTLTLTGDNSYTGDTTINAGLLQIGDGGASGSILGNVVNNGRFAIDRSDTLTLAGTISGSGEVLNTGTGTTILTAANSYTGATRVSAGTLLINGDQSAATGLTAVATNATLGGTGVIGGDVLLGDGTLAPGAGGAGTLTINGDLSMAAGSHLAVDFGAANAVGSPLNDAIAIGGDLVLDGTIDVAVTPGGSFGIGLYRVASYGGALVDNGLALGTMPAGADVFVQTAIAGQVNLINTGSAVLNFWDGDAGPKFNGAVDGGNGTWLAASGDNWTDTTGAVNAPYDNGAFAIFAGTGGTVEIDDSLGAVGATGLQFASDGYTITGDALTLTGPQSVVRVGDGTAAGAGYTATVASEIAGSTQLVKDDLGTLVLTGTNTYTGGTAIEGGTLSIASDANLGAAAGGLGFDGGTLATTADIASARTVTLVGEGVLSTAANTTLTLTGGMTGAGGLGKAGSGTLVLAGSGSYVGGTSVTAGTLLVNGDYGAATGLTSIAPGATLGGTGTIGGDLRLEGTLAPGAGGAGTLAIAGDLAIGQGATLAYQFGQAGTAGGALNDLVTIGGDLVLDGTIEVTVPAGGAFDVGVYRVFDYGGALTDNGLTLGTLPAGSAVTVQTAVSGQVNLVNTGGQALGFWDGAAGPKNDGTIQGGTGVWQNSTGNDNWTNAEGTVNGAYADGAFAIFGGAGGTVTVDGSLGQVAAAGLQFAADGYTVTGDALALTGPQATVRVGDGSAQGAGFTATIASEIAGSTQLVKTDGGTLVLAGSNSYTGGTAVTGGTVQVSADANLGAVAGAVTLDGGTLATTADLASARDIVMAGAGTISTAAGTTFTFDGLLSGTGALTKAGAGTLLVTGNNAAFAGHTGVEGTLRVDGSLCGDVDVRANGRLEGTGTVCSTVNAGTVAPGHSIGTLTVAGSYTGNGGLLEIEAELGGDASPADRLVVTQGTAGATRVAVINTGGLGAQTVEGIKIVDVTGGASNGTFTLEGDYDFRGAPAVIAGAYGYQLFKGGTSTPTDGDWYLRSALLEEPEQPAGPLYQPGTPLYESYAEVLQGFNQLPTMQQRVGNRQWAQAPIGEAALWGRIEGSRLERQARLSTTGTHSEFDGWKAQIGVDRTLHESANSTFVGGLTAHYGEGNAEVRSIFGNGEIDTKVWGVGATFTWFGPEGLYADAQGQLSKFTSDLESGTLGQLADGNDGRGQAASLEVGKRVALGGGLSLTPQVQAVYQNVEFDTFADPFEAAVASDKADSLRTRWGISIDHASAWEADGSTRRSHLYGLVNLDYEWLEGTRVDVSGTPLLRAMDRLWGEVAAGGSLTVGTGVTLYAQGSASTSLNNFGDSYDLKGVAGVRFTF